jgi:hypothetical protein
MPRILIIGDAVARTGFARMIRNIFRSEAVCKKIRNDLSYAAFGSSYYRGQCIHECFIMLHR